MGNRIFSIAIAAAGLTGCAGIATTPVEAESADIAAWSGELPIGDPWLRERLPVDAIGYARVPHPLALIAMPKGNALDTALGSEANIRNLINIQQGLAENLGVQLPPARLIENLRSPLEIAVVGLPTPSVTIAATTTFRTNADFESFVAELGEFLPVTLAAPLDDEGFGTLAGAPVAMQVHFDASTGRMAVHAALAADRSVLTALVAPAGESVEHAMHRLESQIDDSGQGVFIWFDTARALQTGALFLPADVMARLQASGADQVRALAAGAGVANGKGRLKLLADVGTDSTNRPLPIVRNEITATSVGEPRNLVLLSLPGIDELRRLQNVILANLPSEAADGWARAEDAFAAANGVTLDEILAAVGSDLVRVSDRAGSYFGLRVRDHALLDEVLERWSAAIGVTIGERPVAGEVVRYVDLPRRSQAPDQASAGPARVLSLLGQLRNRVYWIAEGDYLYVASMPQPLIDRIGIGADTPIAGWLNDTQRVDLSSSLLAATGAAGNLPRTMYASYLAGMQAFADLVGVEYDAWAMPTANQLGLPDRGTLGATVNLGEPYVSLELSYENHPAEIVIGGAGMAATVMGFIAGIAVPVYRNRVLDSVPVPEAVTLVEASAIALPSAR